MCYSLGDDAVSYVVSSKRFDHDARLPQDRRPQYQAILCLFFVPSFANALAWVKLSRHYPKVGFFFMMAVTFFGFPSPLFVCVKCNDQFVCRETKINDFLTDTSGTFT